MLVLGISQPNGRWSLSARSAYNLVRGLAQSQEPLLNAANPDFTMHQHVVQIGDPVLRQKSKPVDTKDITTPAVQSIIKNLKDVMIKYGTFGISACQMGVPARISAVQVTAGQFATMSPKKARDAEIIPMKVIINPEIKIVKKSERLESESCCSVHGWEAHVPRWKEVSVTYFNEEGNKVENWLARGLTARILQHEIDHLDGVMFTDRMKKETFVSTYWRNVNGTGGECKLLFGGIEDLSKKWYFSLGMHKKSK